MLDLCISPQNPSAKHRGGESKHPYLYDAAIFHHVAMHFLVLCLVLLLLHLGRMLKAERRAAECSSTLLTLQEQAPEGPPAPSTTWTRPTIWFSASESSALDHDVALSCRIKST